MLVNLITIWNILRPLRIFTAFWSSLWSFGIFFPIWHVWTKKYLATLITTETKSELNDFNGSADYQGDQMSL
jgi:uncharacterized membrane protein YjgN (DUF898 family)